MAFGEATEAFLELSVFPPQTIEDGTMATLERFTVLLYGRTSGDLKVSKNDYELLEYMYIYNLTLGSSLSLYLCTFLDMNIHKYFNVIIKSVV